MPEAAGLNWFDADPNLAFAVCRLLSATEYERAEPLLRELGARAGREIDALAREAETHPPELRQWDARGNRIDAVVYHPSYHALERIAFKDWGFAAMSHRSGVLGWPGRVPHVVKYALSYIFVQAEFGLFCPVSMTDSLARVLAMFGDEALVSRWLPRLITTDMDELMQGAMFLTEKQGGSDLGQTETIARREGDRWRLWGDKWFCSNVAADLILTLARPAGAPAGTRGLGLYLVPQRLDDGSRNAYRINRLKDKLGTRDMATGEVTLDGALAHQVGDLDRGFRQMAEMINVSRLSNAMRAAALMRRGLLESLVHCQAREAFGRRLIDLPLMRVTLFDMLIDVEGALALVLDAAQTLDRADAGSELDRRLLRILTPIAKAALTRQARAVTGEALEVRGGNGYVEDWVEPRLLRDSHLGSVWEGATNVVALDVLRAMTREGAAEILFDDTERRLRAVREPAVGVLAANLVQSLAALSARAAATVADGDETREAGIRRLVARLAHLRIAALLTEEAEHQLRLEGSSRKLLVAALYAARHLAAEDDALQAHADRAAVRWLPAVAAWSLVPATATAALLAAFDGVVQRKQGVTA
jgi:acyl-CoA dehydrogenase